MSEESIDRGLRLIEALIPSETNKEAGLIEKHLGLKFPVIPKMYRVNRLTEAILRARNAEEGKSLRTFLRSFREGVVDLPVALDGETIILPSKEIYRTPYYRFHENGHAYHFQKDPSVTEVGSLAKRLELGELSQQEWKGEEWLVNRVFVEGVGLVVALQAAIRMAEFEGDASIAVDAYKHIDEIVGMIGENRVAEEVQALGSSKVESMPDAPMKTDYTEMRTQQLRDDVIPSVSIREDESLDDVRNRMWLVMEYVSDAQYTVGWSFVSQAMQELESTRDLSFADSLDWLIAHRPRTLRDLEDPKIFVNGHDD